MRFIKTVKDIYNLEDYVPADGDVIVEEPTQRIYVWSNNTWMVVSPDVSTSGFITTTTENHDLETTTTSATNMTVSIKDGNLTTLSLYDLNKQIISQMPALTDKEIEEKINLIKEFKNTRSAEFYMLLNNEIRYYTLFRLSHDFLNVYLFEQEVVNCLKDLGTIKSIDLNDDGIIEAWVQLNDNDETIILYLFPYDEGVISCL